jgi:alanyl-tRNA synthetase
MGKMALSLKDDIIKNSHEIKGINVLTYYIENMDINSLRNLGDEIKNSIGSGVIVLASSLDGKLSFVSMVTKDLIDKGLHAGKIIKKVSQCTGGGGGGRPDMAQAGGKDINKVNQALNLVYDIIEKQLK